MSYNQTGAVQWVQLPADLSYWATCKPYLYIHFTHLTEPSSNLQGWKMKPRQDDQKLQFLN